MAEQQGTEKSAKQVVPAEKETGTRQQLTFGERWTYADAPEAKDHAKIRERYDLFIDGRWQAPKSKEYFTTQNPATEEKLATWPGAGRSTGQSRRYPAVLRGS